MSVLSVTLIHERKPGIPQISNMSTRLCSSITLKQMLQVHITHQSERVLLNYNNQEQARGYSGVG